MQEVSVRASVVSRRKAIIFRGGWVAITAVGLLTRSDILIVS